MWFVGILFSPHRVIIPKVVNPALFLDAALCLLRGVANGVSRYGEQKEMKRKTKKGYDTRSETDKRGIGLTKLGNSKRRINYYHKNRRENMKKKRKRKQTMNDGQEK